MRNAAPIESDSDSADEHDFETPTPNKNGMFSPKARPFFFNCLRCGNNRPLEKMYRLCAFCIQECNRDPKQEKFWLRGNREQPESPTAASPGSSEKIGVLRRRVLRGEELFGAEDAVVPVDWAKVNIAAMLADPIMREIGQTGVERDGDNWRARPMYAGEKRNLGMYKNEYEAVDKVREFWQGIWGVDENSTPEEIAEAKRKDELRQQIQARENKAKADLERRLAIVHPLYPDVVLDGSQQAV